MKKFLFILTFFCLSCNSSDNGVEVRIERRININPQNTMSIYFPNNYYGKISINYEEGGWFFSLTRNDEKIAFLGYPPNSCYLELPDTFKILIQTIPDTIIHFFSNKIIFNTQYGFPGALYHNNNNLDTTGFRNTASIILLQSKYRDNYCRIFNISYNYKFQKEVIDLLKTLKYN